MLLSGSSEALVEFRTLFARGVGLRFKFTRDGRTEVIAASVTEPSALMEALAASTGVSAGAAHTIPALLLPEANAENWSLLRLAAVHMVSPSQESEAGEWRMEIHRRHRLGRPTNEDSGRCDYVTDSAPGG